MAQASNVPRLLEHALHAAESGNPSFASESAPIAKLCASCVSECPHSNSSTRAASESASPPTGVVPSAPSGRAHSKISRSGARVRPRPKRVIRCARQFESHERRNLYRPISPVRTHCWDYSICASVLISPVAASYTRCRPAKVSQMALRSIVTCVAAWAISFELARRVLRLLVFVPSTQRF